MGVPKEQAARNRDAIVETASRVFRERGVGGVCLADLMKEAGFTHGGFYNHFPSKDALAAEACARAFAGAGAMLDRAIAADREGPGGGLQALMTAYLSTEHCDAPGSGCPSAALAVDAARQGHEMQAAYAQGIATFIDTMARHMSVAPGEETSVAARQAAIGVLASLVGTMMLARGVGGAVPDLREEILAATRERLSRVVQPPT